MKSMKHVASLCAVSNTHSLGEIYRFLLMVLLAVYSLPLSATLDRTRLRIGAYSVNKVMMTEDHVRDVKACGVDFLVGAPVDNREFLDWCYKYGVRIYVANGVLLGVPGWWDHERHGGTPADTNQLARVAELIEGFKRNLDHPAIEMVDIYDEPSALTFPYYGELVGVVNGLSAEKPGYVNLFPIYALAASNSKEKQKSQLGAATYRDYIAEYCRNIPSDYISYDHYQYLSDNPSTVRKFCARSYENMAVVADACRSTGRSFWYVPQVNSYMGSVRKLSANQLRFQAYSAMAFGAESIAWACYSRGWWKDNVIDDNGEKTEQYAKLKMVNKELHCLGPKYMRFRNTATHFVGFGGHLDELPQSGEKSLHEFSNGFFMNVKANDDSPLVIGEMSARNLGDCAKGLFVFAAGDVMDEYRIEHEIELRVRGFKSVEVVGPDGPIAFVRDAGGRVGFKLKDNSCALLFVE